MKYHVRLLTNPGWEGLWAMFDSKDEITCYMVSESLERIMNRVYLNG